ncbi:MAG: MFS transporter [Deltaproteobacteria bacterium]|nr:MAG: MFS transporter [Deltaproteobacteria bacterium]
MPRRDRGQWIDRGAGARRLPGPRESPGGDRARGIEQPSTGARDDPEAAATLLFGWAGDRYDRRRVIVVGVVLASLAGAAGALGHSYWELAASRACVGLGTAAVVPVANSILGEIFEGPLKASRLSIFNLGLFLGGVIGFATGIALGFPAVVVTLAAPGIALAVWIAVLPGCAA